MRPLVLAALLGLSLLAAALAARAQTPPPDPAICNASLREWGGLAAGSDYQAMERLLARTPNACRHLRAQIQARITALRPAPPVDACAAAEARWTGGLRSSTDRAALQRFISDTPTRCAIVRDAAQARLAGLPAPTTRPPPATTTRPPATTTTPPTTTSTTWRAGQEFDDCSGADWCPRMVVIPAGSFMMGSPASETGRSDNEGPQRRVSIRQFAVGKFEVTWDQWMACVNRGGCTGNAAPADQSWGRGTRPVINVSWNDAREYVQWLSRETGRNYRLISEAEWEYAARAGTTGRFSNNGAEAELCQIANHADQSTSYSWRNTACSDGVGERTAPVGQYRANTFGLFDMHGNVWEWTQDCYAASYSGLPTDGSAIETGACSDRVFRGGSLNYDPQVLRSANRNWGTPSLRDSGVGFRVARTLN